MIGGERRVVSLSTYGFGPINTDGLHFLTAFPGGTVVLSPRKVAHQTALPNNMVGGMGRVKKKTRCSFSPLSDETNLYCKPKTML